jgi:uncharacterized membrane protein HdeD (DUF308 family)
MLSNILSRFWWTTLFRGAMWILFGLFILVRPGISLVSLILAVGLLFLADGLANVVAAFGGREHSESWWVLLLAGLAGIAVGVLTFFSPGATALTLLYFIAVWAIAVGIMEIVAAVNLRKEIEGELWLGLAGLASVAFGAYLIARPGAGVLAVLWLIAAYAIAFGTMLILHAFEARSFVKRITSA